MPVYVIRVVGTTKVKIGRADHVGMRRADLQIAHTDQLQILREIPGDAAEEKWMHQHFAAQRIRGEWFRFNPDMLTVVPEPQHADKWVSEETARVLSGITGMPAHTFTRSLETLGGQDEPIAIFHEFTCDCGATVVTGPAEQRSGRKLLCSNCRALRVEQIVAERRRKAA